MLIATMEAIMAVELRLSAHAEDYIRGSDMVSIMTGKWNELYKIKTGKIGRVDLSHEFHVLLGVETENFNFMWSQRAFDYEWSAQKNLKCHMVAYHFKVQLMALIKTRT